MKSTTCPDQHSLEQLLLGKMPLAEAEPLEEHLLHCDQCAARADTISASDTLTAALQSVETVYGEDDIVAQVIERGKQLRSNNETAMSNENETVIGEGATSSQESSETSPVDDEIDFLALPQQPDEIGRLGGYRILEVLGVGGMGIVFRAEDPNLKRQIALKAMKPTVASSKSAKERFIREAQSTAAIEHDNIVHIYQVGEDSGVPFIAMQFLRGESLQKKIERKKQLDQKEVLRIGREIATGLAEAHQRHLIHRDIKPDNIWIEDKTNRAKILDFGLVRSASADESGLTQDGTVLGTPKYMAPEQAQGEKVDHCCDLYSLGAVLYRLASGQVPFQGNSVMAVLMALMQDDPQPLEELCPEMDPDWARLIMQLLSKNPADRPQSALDIVEAITKIEQQIDATKIEESFWASQQQGSSGKQTRTKIANSGNRRAGVGKWIALLGGGMAAVVFLGVIIIKITSPDGTVTEIQVPEGSKVEVATDSTKDKPNINPKTSTPAKKMPAKTVPQKTEVSNIFPRPEYDPSPLPKLGTWEPVGTANVRIQFPSFLLSNSQILPGLVMRPAGLPGIRRWNVETRLPRSNVLSAEFSPDGKLLALGTIDGHIRIYDTATLQLKRLLPGLTNGAGVTCISWHPDGTSLAANSMGGRSLSIWDLDGTLKLQEYVRASAIQYSPDGQLLAVLNHSHFIQLRDHDARVIKQIPLQDEPYSHILSGSLTWSPDSQHFATLHADNKLRIWTRKGTLKKEVEGFGNLNHYLGHGIQWSPTGEWIGVIDGAKPTEIQRIGTNGEHGDPIKIAETGIYHRFQWSPDGKRIYAGGHGPLKLIDIATGKTIAQGPFITENALAVSSDGKYVISTLMNLTLQDMDLTLQDEKLKELLKFKTGFSQPGCKVRWNPAGTQFASGCFNGTFHLWENNGKITSMLGTRYGHASAIAWHPGGEKIVLSTGGEAGFMFGNPNESLTKNTPTGYYKASWSGNGKYFAAAVHSNSYFDIYDSQAVLLKRIAAPKHPVSIAFKPDETLLTVTCGTQLYICRPENDWKLEPLFELTQKPVWIRELVWCKDGSFLMIQGTGVLKYTDGKFSVVTGFSDDVACTWSPDGKRLARVYGTQLSALERATGRILKNFFFTAGGADFIDWHPSRDLFTTIHQDSTIISWDADAMEPYWRAVQLPGGNAVTFTAAGQILHGDRKVVERHLVYYIETEAGKIETLTPTEFEKRIGESIFATQ